MRPGRASRFDNRCLSPQVLDPHGEDTEAYHRLEESAQVSRYWTAVSIRDQSASRSENRPHRERSSRLRSAGLSGSGAFWSVFISFVDPGTISHGMGTSETRETPMPSDLGMELPVASAVWSWHATCFACAGTETTPPRNAHAMGTSGRPEESIERFRPCYGRLGQIGKGNPDTRSSLG